jgi:hypothetical protein
MAAFGLDFRWKQRRTGNVNYELKDCRAIYEFVVVFSKWGERVHVITEFSSLGTVEASNELPCFDFKSVVKMPPSYSGLLRGYSNFSTSLEHILPNYSCHL